MNDWPYSGPMVEIEPGKWVRSGVDMMFTGQHCQVCPGNVFSVQPDRTVQCKSCQATYRVVPDGAS